MSGIKAKNGQKVYITDKQKAANNKLGRVEDILEKYNIDMDQLELILEQYSEMVKALQDHRVILTKNNKIYSARIPETYFPDTKQVKVVKIYETNKTNRTGSKRTD